MISETRGWIYLNDRDVDVLAIRETRLESDFPKELIFIHGYNWIGRDRDRKLEIGLLVGLAFILLWNNNADIEVLTVEISKYETKPFIISKIWKHVE